MSIGMIKLSMSGFVGTPEITKADDYKTVYSNAARVGVGPWDLRITFAHIIENKRLESEAQDLVTIVFSPPEAKALLKMLQGAIVGYEELFGEIRDIQSLLEKAQSDELPKNP
jgi:hypothetical protein